MSVPESAQTPVIQSLIAHALPRPSDLPAAFPNTEIPCFLYGDRVRWISDQQTTDWGLVIGRFYSFAPHCDRWCWCYLIWLDHRSPSSAWVQADIAWEDDLEAFDEVSNDVSIGSETV